MVPDERDDTPELLLLRDSIRSEWGQAIYKRVQEKLAEAQATLNDKAIVSGSEPKRDWRYWKGRVAALTEVMNLPEEAEKQLKKHGG